MPIGLNRLSDHNEETRILIHFNPLCFCIQRFEKIFIQDRRRNKTMSARRVSFLCAMLFVFCLCVKAQDVDVTKLPGYIDLEKIEIPDKAGELMDVSIGPALLKIVQGDDSWEKDSDGFLGGIVSVRIKSFEVGHDAFEKVRPIMDEIEKKLKRENWEMLVRVKDDDQTVNVSMKLEGEKIVGILVMAVDPGDDVMFVNVVGSDIRLDRIGRMGLGLGGLHMGRFFRHRHRY